jgi:hypothetical protein
LGYTRPYGQLYDWPVLCQQQFKEGPQTYQSPDFIWEEEQSMPEKMP